MVGILWMSRLVAILRVRHPQKWEAMGCPTLVSNNSPNSSKALLDFISSTEADAMGDPELIKLCWKLKKLMFAYIAAFLGAIIVIPLVASR
jgi:hypothetical protein